MNEEVRWLKSSRSGAQSNCVELSNQLNAVRDSKNPTTIGLRGDVRRLLDSVITDRITR